MHTLIYIRAIVAIGKASAVPMNTGVGGAVVVDKSVTAACGCERCTCSSPKACEGSGAVALLWLNWHTA